MTSHAAVDFFFNDTATTEIYTLSLHDALPISPDAAPQHRERPRHEPAPGAGSYRQGRFLRGPRLPVHRRSEEHTSELQSRQYLVCRLLLEKKKTKTNAASYPTSPMAALRRSHH